MADGVNKVILIGRLGADPDSKKVGDSTVTQIRLATNESWTDKKGERQQKTEWHRVVCWGKRADAMAKYFSKGDGIFIEGRLSTRKWEDKDGNTRYTTEVVTTDWQFLPGTGGRDSDRDSDRDHRREGRDTGPDSFEGGPPPMDDDIPF
jgi:single-strand DNA-binding protein